ncbi:tetratricopeptide (TPR) repeat protein [Streptomyces griseochromogenes]|uniref:Tetratricopeptide (TPR) repeat protein n=2 Tax=Streptomyces griseochromogenes TaxID=68214 RepID=A0ABS4LZ61_9ACTN|nr:tetratricopeptide repeat protein [Streptomyces griseochromogenes]MBP2052703.1 tetratricopeptide (TPR) repeat protein [Streptomyces griseochromogenes]
MARARRSMQELIGRRRRAGFVGRGDERAAFRQNLDLPPEDERHRFLFHIHGNAGVGKTFLVRELEQIARERGALTAYVDEGVGSVPEAMAAMSREFAGQGHEVKKFDRALAAWRERRHEAEAVVAGLEPEGPSPVTATAVRAGLAGLGLIPGAGPFVGAVDATQFAQYADRLRRGLSARFASQDDVQLVLSPEQVLTPKLLDELADLASTVPWIVLFFDTYERIAPFADAWLYETMTTDRHGTLPANVVVVTAGQRPFDTARWAGFADFMTDVPLGPFTEAEARGLLADRGVVAEPVVAEVLRLTGGLPLLVSTLAEQRPTDPDDIGDPSATAVERFLKWEPDPVRRGVALACALPRRLDADVFRAVAERPEDETEALYDWLRGLPFVGERSDRAQYHDVVRASMLRLQRRRSPRGWARRQRRLAEEFGRWQEETAAGRPADELWADAQWRELRLEESYHMLCALPAREALPLLLGDVTGACTEGEVVARRWVQTLVEAGEDADSEAVRAWGRDLLGALEEGIFEALGLLLHRGCLDTSAQVLARVMRARELRRRSDYEGAVAECEHAMEADADSWHAYYWRALVRADLRDHESAVADLDRAEELSPDNARVLYARGEYRREQGLYGAALGDLDRAVALQPGYGGAWASRGVTQYALGRLDRAHSDLDRALDLDPEDVWALTSRSRVWRDRGEHDRQLADLDRALRLLPDSPWIACVRGDALRNAGRDEEALAEYDRALRINPDYASAHASRGASLANLGRHGEALAALDRALELVPDYPWAMDRRTEVLLALSSPPRS